jgi:hypothetical protein
MFQLAPLPLTERALNRFGELFTQHIKQKLQQSIYPYAPGYNGGGTIRPGSPGNKVATGRLLNSIDYSVEIDLNGDPTLVLTYLDYFDNVNWGRRPKKKKVPITNILEWIGIRGIAAQNNQGIPISPLSLAFAIQTNIYKFGIKPTNIYDKGLDGLLDFVDNPPPELADEWQDVYDMIAEDVNKFLEQTITVTIPSRIE